MSKPSKNTLHEEILSDIKSIGNNAQLQSAKNFNERSEAIDFIEFHVIDRINALVEKNEASDELEELKKYALKVREELEEINSGIYNFLRMKISKENLRSQPLLTLINEYLNYDFGAKSAEEGYDNLDIFLNGLFSDQKLPVETRKREPEMVFYQKTPARIILNFIKRSALKPNDVFFDLGSGLGQAVILVNLLTGIKSIGVEYEPAFCRYARSKVEVLNLSEVYFTNEDARYADYSSGTVFFMYSPFEGKILDEVLQKLKRESENRMIKILTYGPCTPEVAEQPWLTNKRKIKNNMAEAGEFESI
jgi:Histone methylation protein DOT1